MKKKLKELKTNIIILSRLIRGRIFKQKIPIFVSYAITRKCNMSCKYCHQREYGTSEELSTDEAKNLITDLSNNGTSLLMISGGEPLLRKDIDLLVNHAIESGLAVAMSTNGSLITEHLNMIGKLSYISISLDGPREIHDSVRGKGSFDLAVKGINAAFGAGVKTLITTTIGNHNIESIDFIFDFSRQNGVIHRFQV